MDIKIIYEDDYIIVLDKPAGIPTHKLKPEEEGTVVNFLMEYCPSITGVGTDVLMSGLAHRLDTGTSGLVLAVKDNESFLKIRKQFKEHEVLKGYLTLVHGRYNGPMVISNFIGKDKKNKKRVKVYPDDKKGARLAETEVIKKEYYGDYTLLKLKIKTGMRHQIRAQLANIGNPIVGDLLYQNVKNRQRDQLGLERHFLHAYKLGFFHPRTGKWVEFTSKLPEDLNGILLNL